tara:strand:+ start:232 stop:804 length:573 start_codon:yes stop_codon:yes gene_type:complete
MISTRAPTVRQMAVLRAIASYIRAQGRSPTYAELVDLCGFRSEASVVRHLWALERRQLLTRQYGRQRSIRITESGQHVLARDGDVTGAKTALGSMRKWAASNGFDAITDALDALWHSVAPGSSSVECRLAVTLGEGMCEVVVRDEWAVKPADSTCPNETRRHAQKVAPQRVADGVLEPNTIATQKTRKAG